MYHSVLNARRGVTTRVLAAAIICSVVGLAGVFNATRLRIPPGVFDLALTMLNTYARHTRFAFARATFPRKTSAVRQQNFARSSWRLADYKAHTWRGFGA